jgi:hypothetical protein
MIAPTIELESDKMTEPAGLLIREARAASRRRRQRALGVVSVVLAATLTGVILAGSHGSAGRLNNPVSGNGANVAGSVPTQSCIAKAKRVIPKTAIVYRCVWRRGGSELTLHRD